MRARVRFVPGDIFGFLQVSRACRRAHLVDRQKKQMVHKILIIPAKISGEKKIAIM
jgi:hypothetical protein